MGRRRTKNHDLPPGVHRKGERLYYGRNDIPLGPENDPAWLRRWAELRGERITGAAATFADAAREYRLHELAGKARKTQAEYDRQLRTLCTVFGLTPLAKIRPHHVGTYLDRRPPIAGTREKALLSAVFNVARRRGLTDSPNPCAGIRGKKARRGRYVTDAELADALRRADPVLAGFLELCYRTGQRPSDVTRMTRADVREGALWVTQAKTGAKVRIGVRGPLAVLLAAPEAVASVYLIHDARGQPMTLGALRKRFDKLGVDWQIRDLRAKYATDLGDPQKARAGLGHANQTTTDTYIRAVAGESADPITREIADAKPALRKSKAPQC
jgi:integrase